ncbi:MAG: A24 family peptidase [Gemmataceae bacterium]|nr:A24 family peptidase [Gemmataceae bacterium]
MGSLFDPINWPLWVVIVGMILAAVIDGWKRKVPNWLTFTLVLSGWLLGLLHDFGLRLDGNGETTGIGGIGASLACTAIGFFLLFPLLLVKGMGQGDVKMQMGFGAWVGSFFGLAQGWLVVVLAFCVGAIIGGIIGLGIMAVRRSYKENVRNMQGILMDVVVTGSLTQMQQRGEQLRDKGPKLPYGIPLCLGFVGYLVYLVYFVHNE